MSKQILHTDSAPGRHRPVLPGDSHRRLRVHKRSARHRPRHRQTRRRRAGAGRSVHAQHRRDTRRRRPGLRRHRQDDHIRKRSGRLQDRERRSTRPSLRATIRRAAACRSPRCPWADWSRSSASRAPEARGAAGSKHIEWHLTSAHWQSARLRFAAASGVLASYCLAPRLACRATCALPVRPAFGFIPPCAAFGI